MAEERVDTHDDMVVVVALAAWWAERRVKLTRA